MTLLLARDGAVTRGEALADQAYAVVRDAILSHALPPGARLSVPEIARQLSISRSPAREAIARIQHEGLAEFVPHRGAVVSRIDLDSLVEIYDIREVLEGLAARLAARRESELADELQALWERHKRAVEADDEVLHVQLDTAFHQRIREAAGNQRLAEALERLQGQIRIAMTTTARRGGGRRTALREHGAIIDAIRSGSGDFAEEVARQHIRRLRQSLNQASDESAADDRSGR